MTVTVPVTEYLIEAAPPLVIQSCVLAPPPSPPEPEPEEAIFTPVAPGITIETLPVIPEIIDTSPDQVIGCANDVGTDPQQVLNVLFPAAISGDGVVDRASNDFWVYDGTTWNNVGPNPGPTLTVVTTIPPWNEILLYTARVRTRLRVSGFAYALQLLAEPDPFVVRIGLDVESTKTDPDAVPFSAVVMPYSYTGNGSTQTISGLFEPGIVMLRSTTSTTGDRSTYTYDQLRGPTRSWKINSPDLEATNVDTLTAFTADGFTVGSSSIVNESAANYIGHIFRHVGDPLSNTDGTITSAVAQGEAYNIISYTGNGTAGASIGHGLGADPELIIVKRMSGTQTWPALAGGKIVGDDYWMQLNSEQDRSLNTAVFRTTNTSTFTVGNSGGLNANTADYIAYAFKNVPRVSFLGTYVGDGATGGKFIDCGFDVDYVLVKGRDGGTLFGQGSWLVFDNSDTSGKRFYELDRGVPYEEDDVMCTFESTGFRVDRGGSSSFAYRDLNISSATYIFMAFARRTPSVVVPVQAVTLEALAPIL